MTPMDDEGMIMHGWKHGGAKFSKGAQGRRGGWCRLLMLAGLALGAGVAGADSSRSDAAMAEGGSARPHSPPALTLKGLQHQARAGQAQAQRDLAVAYETGYLVQSSPSRAEYWYRRAAKSGDGIAREWVAHHDQLVSLGGGKECLGDYCYGGGQGEGAHAASFVAAANNHYFAPVTINGVTEQGMIDTGASTIAMSPESAKHFGIDASHGKQQQFQTANGKTIDSVITVPKIQVGGLVLRNVMVSVGSSGPILIGMSFLHRLNLRMGGGVLTLSR